jgi:hypothetical protein
MRHSYSILVGKPEGDRLLGRLGGGQEYNIRIDFRETGWEGVDWVNMAQDREQWRALVKKVMNLRVL